MSKKLRLSTSFLPLYGIGLALLALFGILIYSEPSALSFLNHFPAATRGIYVVPSLIINALPGWLAGIALLGVFVGGLVPAAIMAIAQANLLTRNIIKELKPNLTQKGRILDCKVGLCSFQIHSTGVCVCGTCHLRDQVAAPWRHPDHPASPFTLHRVLY